MGKKLTSIIILTLIFTILSINFMGCRQTAEEEREREVAVEVVSVAKDNIIENVILPSVLHPKKNSMIFPKTPGLEVTKLAVQVGDTVQEGDFLFELDKTPIRRQVEMARKNYEQSQKSYRLQKQQHQKAEDLVPPNIPDGIMVFQQNRSLVENNMAEGALLTAEAQLEQSRLAYVNALEQLKEMEYYAPIAGVVSQISLQENQPVINTQPALIITNTDKLKTELNITRELLNTLELDKKVKIHIREATKEGIVTAINWVADPRTGLHLVEITVDNTTGQLTASSFCRVAIQRQSKENVLVIPKEAVFLENNQSIVFVEENNRAHKRRVELGMDNGIMVEVISGLKEGERVIVKGQHYIDENTSLVVVGGEDDESK
ncbi:MAG: efflux RND transporter periplasmic adaptor subunit [Clostridiaceae bacterium]|nr:efflux RND transporter periplasmic adaptor subunit [Clostridiaceae bacterium]